MLLLCSIILAGVSGCDTRFKVDALLSQYVADLNRSQYFSLIAPATVMPESLPSFRFRQQPLTKFDIGLLDFLSLQQCDVGVIAGRKNSILGKVMTDSQRFLYELDIIRAIESCDLKESELSATLRSVAQQKRRELPKAFGNALFNGKESEAFFSLSNGFVPLNYSTAEQQELLDALGRLVVIGEQLSSLPKVESVIFEGDLKILMDSEYAGRLLYSLMQLTEYLKGVSGVIAHQGDEVCGAPVVFLKQQFERHYVQQIQPYMGRINQSAYQVLPLLTRLVSLSSPHTEPLDRFLGQLDFESDKSVWQEYQLASQQHAGHWSALFERCALPLTAAG